MPIYEYQCKSCDHELEALQKISEGRLVYCPECGEATLRKLVSAAAFRLKGTGWYETDFKNQDKSKGDKKSADTDSKTESKDDKKSADTDSKTESKDAKTDTKKSESKDASSKTKPVKSESPKNASAS